MSTASVARGPESPVLDITIGDMVAGMAACFPDRDAIVSRHQNVCLSWREFDQETDRTARGLAALDLKPLDRVGLCSANCVEWIVLQIACAKAGLILVGLDQSVTVRELALILKKSQIKALFLWDHDARWDYSRILLEITRDQDLALEHVVWMGTNSWMNMLTAGRGLPEYEPQSSDTVVIQYHSNSDGTPNGVPLTHRSLLNYAWAGSAWLHITEQDRICNPCKLSHCSGSLINGLAAFIRGASVVLPSAEFDAGAVLESIEEEQATVLGGSPEMYRALLDHPEFERFDLSSLRVAWMGSAPCPPRTFRDVTEKMSIPRLAVIYGRAGAPWIAMSEAYPNLCSVMPNTEVKLVQPGAGTPVPPGSFGELCVRGPFVIRGYDGDAEATRRIIDPDGWLHTGDLAALRPSGILEFAAHGTDFLKGKPSVREELSNQAASVRLASLHASNQR